MRLVLAAVAASAFVFSAAAADAPPVSPACALLTEAEATQILGHKPMVSDGGSAYMGTSGCSWVDTETYNAIGLTVMGGEAFAGGTADAYYEQTKTGLAISGKPEDVTVGDKAFLLDMSGSLTLTALKGDKVFTLTGSGITKEKMVEAGTLVAGHL